jgi:hypothetical protein
VFSSFRARIDELLRENFTSSFNSIFGVKYGNSLIAASAGSIIGVGEVLLLPFDVMKIKAQTNPASLKGQGILELLRSNGLGLWSGAGWTALRNAPGSFALFGASSLVYDFVFGLEDKRKANFIQTSTASLAGSIASIIVSAPFDVIKTRIQREDFGVSQRGIGRRIVKNMIEKEGIRSFFKGLMPKLFVVGPKLVFSFTIAQLLMVKFDEMAKQWSNKQRNKPTKSGEH